ncbi:hypothetical protein IAD21_03531 [Abditibacteriota bacterium]|nr:hypothetical protein IAD21_03531 [Abditibacteriota bacterium]
MKFSSMRWADDGPNGPFAKDPVVVRLGDFYFLYYSVFDASDTLHIGIARSSDLDNWEKVGELGLVGEAERNGIGAPGAIVLENKVHLFYQTYGNWRLDAICHAVSVDGVHFERTTDNPIFRPEGDWNCGRAIDADVVAHDGTLYLYCATRDPDMEIQMLALATAPLDCDFGPGAWTQRGEGPILKPDLPWEEKCIEAPAVLRRDGKFWMFYAGAYNAAPQQIGLAVSDDGVNWRRTSNQPFLRNGEAGSWNADESGHPGVFVGNDGRVHLFFQGTNDKGKTWFLSRVEIEEADWPQEV